MIWLTWWNSSWSYRQKLTLSTSQLSNDVTDDLPILVKVDSTNTAFWNHVDSTGKDVRFVASDDTTALTYHFEKFDYSGQEMIAWVKVTDTFTSASDTDIYLYYGSASATNAQDEAGTYPSAFQAVYHHKDASGTTLSDSTSNNRDGTLKSSTEPQWVSTGKFGYGSKGDGSNDYVNLGWNPSAITETTILFWLKPTITWDSSLTAYRVPLDYYSSDTQYLMIAQTDDGRFGYYNTSDGFTSDTKTFSAGTWYFIAVTVSSSGTKVYTDGSQLASSAGTHTFSYVGSNQHFTYFASYRAGAPGHDPCDATMDEFRILNTPLSADAIKLLYLSESDSLITFGSEEEPSGGAEDNSVFFASNF